MIRAIDTKDYTVYAIGQLVIIEQYFQSTKSLAGKDMFIGVKFDEYEDCEEDRPSGLMSFKMPFGAGSVEIPISNRSLIIESLDDKRFKVIYEFFNTGSTSNQTACGLNSTGSNTLGIAVGYDERKPLSQIQRDQDPCRSSNTCWIGGCANIALTDSSFGPAPVIQYFDGDGNALNGYNLDGATVLRFELPGVIGNTYYLSFCSSYAQINTAVNQVDDLSLGNVVDGQGFRSRDGSAYFATAEISQIISSTGYIVYSNGCGWQAAQFQLAPNTADNSEPPAYPVTYGDTTCEITVNEETVTDCCIGVYPGQSISISTIMDTDDYNSMITSNETYGNYAANFSSAGLCISETPVIPDSDCNISVTHDAGTLTWDGQVDSAWSGKPIYLNFQYTFTIHTPEGSYEDVVNKVVLLNVGEETAITLTEFQDESGTPITGTYCLDENANIKALISGEEGQNFTVFSEDGLSITPASGTFGATDTELTISTTGLEAFGNYCFIVEGEGAVDDSGDNPANCGAGCTQLDISMTLTETGATQWKANISVTATGTNISGISVGNQFFSGTSAVFQYIGSGQPAIATAQLGIGVITSDGCYYFAQGYIETANEVSANNSGVATGCANFEIPWDELTCNNNPGIAMSCGGDGEMSISNSGSVSNVVSDNLQFSGGGTTSDARFDLATRITETSDCGTITINDCFNCESEPDWDQIEECEANNDISITWTFDENTDELDIDLAGTLTDPLTDTVEYSFDGGASWNVFYDMDTMPYPSPIPIPEGVTDIPVRRIATFANCDDAIYNETIILPGSESACLSTPELEATYNETTGMHKATKQGNVYNVNTDIVTFSTDLGESYENYTGPIAANFVIFVRTVTFTNDCPEIKIVKGSTKPIEGIQVNIPAIDVNVNENVTVDCCDGETTFESNNTITCNDEE